MARHLFKQNWCQTTVKQSNHFLRHQAHLEIRITWNQISLLLFRKNHNTTLCSASFIIETSVRLKVLQNGRAADIQTFYTFILLTLLFLLPSYRFKPVWRLLSFAMLWWRHNDGITPMGCFKQSCAQKRKCMVESGEWRQVTKHIRSSTALKNKHHNVIYHTVMLLILH